MSGGGGGGALLGFPRPFRRSEGGWVLDIPGKTHNMEIFAEDDNRGSRPYRHIQNGIYQALRIDPSSRIGNSAIYMNGRAGSNADAPLRAVADKIVQRFIGDGKEWAKSPERTQNLRKKL